MHCSNIYESAKTPLEGDTFETLLSHKNVTIKRIISSSKVDQQVMIQEEDEWFIMIEGEAAIMIADEIQELVTGDYSFIEAKTPHQILSVKEGSIWLAVHF